MKYPKPKRIKDRALLDTFHDKPCIISNQDCLGDVTGHHLISRGAGGNDEPSNLLALCALHHKEVHAIGRETFLRKYKEILQKK